MYSKENLEAVFLEKDLGKLDMALSAIGDELEYANITSDEVVSIVNYFFSRIKDYSNKTIVENILHISLQIMTAQKVFCGFNLDVILPHLYSMDVECSSYVLTFLCFSGDLKYEKVIENFLQNSALKKEAEEALSELRYRAKRNYTAPH